MKKPLYRAKAINRNPNMSYRTTYENGDWVCGLISRYEEDFEICEMTNEVGVRNIDVDIQTVCEYTGLIDRNGKKIFEGDIVKADYDDCWVKIYEVIFYNGGFKMRSKYCETIYDYSIHEEHPDFEVIGNKWDNPELLEELK